MFQSSRNIHPLLTEDVERIESIAGNQVLSGMVCSVPYCVLEVTCVVQQPRQLTLLEEFLLKAAIELDIKLTCEELADLLRVDSRLILATYNHLVEVRALKDSDEKLLDVTPEGDAYYRKGLIPRPPRERPYTLVTVPPYQRFALYDSHTKPELAFGEGDVAPLLLPNLTSFEPGRVLTQQVMIEVTQAAGQPIQSLEEGTTLDEIKSVKIIDEGNSAWGLLVVRDMLMPDDESISLRLRNLNLPVVNYRRAGTVLEDSLRDLLMQEINKDSSYLVRLMGVDPAEYEQMKQVEPPGLEYEYTEAEDRGASAERIVRRRIREVRASQSTLSQLVDDKVEQQGIAELIRDGEIRRSFLKVLDSAKRRVLIVSPWMNEQAVDQELISLFRNLASRKVIVLLGWGISRDRSKEKTPPPPRLLKTLQQIRTPEGMPGVNVRWLGNQHSKDVIVDYAVHLCGSHNWLSYRGDYLPRGESTYRITIPEPVQQAATYIEELFVNSLISHYPNGLADNIEDEVNELHLIATLIGANRFQMAGNWALAAAIRDKSPTSVPLATLCRASSDRLFGADPETRGKLLIKIAEAGPLLLEGLASRQPRQKSRDQEHRLLLDSISCLISKLAEQDVDQARFILSTIR